MILTLLLVLVCFHNSNVSGHSDSNIVTVFQLKLPNITEMPEHDDEEPEEFPETDSGNCFHIQDGGFSYKKSFKKMNSKKLSGTVDFRLKTNVTKALLKENACGEHILHIKKVRTVKITF